jgi:hypothetical protein
MARASFTGLTLNQSPAHSHSASPVTSVVQTPMKGLQVPLVMSSAPSLVQARDAADVHKPLLSEHAWEAAKCDVTKRDTSSELQRPNPAQAAVSGFRGSTTLWQEADKNAGSPDMSPVANRAKACRSSLDLESLRAAGKEPECGQDELMNVVAEGRSGPSSASNSFAQRPTCEKTPSGEKVQTVVHSRRNSGPHSSSPAAKFGAPDTSLDMCSVTASSRSSPSDTHTVVMWQDDMGIRGSHAPMDS